MKTMAIICMLGAFLVARCDKNNSSFIKHINDNQKYLFDKMNNDDYLIKDGNLLVFNPRHNRNCEILNDTIPITIGSGELASIMSCIARIGECLGRNELFDKKSNSRSSYIEDTVVYSIFVTGLSSNDLQIADFAYHILLQESREDFLIKYSEEIKKAIQHYRTIKLEASPGSNRNTCNKLLAVGYNSYESLLPGDDLLFRLDLTTEEKKTFLLKRISSTYYARFGDTKAEQELINKFLSEKDFITKRKLSRSLGTIGTTACINALVKELYSRITDCDQTKNMCNWIGIDILNVLYGLRPDAQYRNDYYYIMNAVKIEYDPGYPAICDAFIKMVGWFTKQYSTIPIDKQPQANDTFLIHSAVEILVSPLRKDKQ